MYQCIKAVDSDLQLPERTERLQFFKQNPVATAKEAKTDLILNVSNRTVQRTAVDHDLRSYTRTNKPFVSEKKQKIAPKRIKIGPYNSGKVFCGQISQNLICTGQMKAIM